MDEWEKKKVNKTTELEELVDYLGYFREAGGVIPHGVERKRERRPPHDRAWRQGAGVSARLHSSSQSGSLSLVRTRRRWLPSRGNCAIRIPITEADDKTLHKQEERRLFYVAMTRARDTLHIYAQRGNRQDQQDAGRLHARADRRTRVFRAGCRRSRPRVRRRPRHLCRGRRRLSGGVANQRSGSRLPVLEGLHTRLSASAVDTYERCGLRFKLERDWRIAAKPAAAMQYGAADPSRAQNLFRFRKAGTPQDRRGAHRPFPQRSGRGQDSGSLPARTLREAGRRAVARLSRRGPLAADTARCLHTEAIV